MKQKICPSQKAALAERIRRTVPGLNYSISKIFSNREAGSSHICAMHRLASPGCLKPGISCGDPLEKMI